MAALATTTLSAAVTAGGTQWPLASLTGITIGTVLFSTGEAVVVTGRAVGLTVPVQRGVLGSTDQSHPSGATVYLGTVAQFFQVNPSGVPPTVPAVTPWINTVNGTIWSAGSSAWLLSGGGSGSAGGATTQVQFNNAGALDGDANFTWDNVNKKLTIEGAPDINEVTFKAGYYWTGASIGTPSQTGNYGYAFNGSANTLNNAIALYADTENVAGGTMNVATGLAIYVASDGVAGGAIGLAFGSASSIVVGVSNHIVTAYGSWVEAINTGTLDNYYGFYGVNLAGQATQPYYVWFNSQGVYSIREDNVADTSSFPQAIPALYNPRFTKYTAGAANFERVVMQWVSNVCQIGTEKGGTGTLRQLSLIGLGVTLPGGTLLTTATALTNGAAAAAGTLLNAPAAGNPTKWIPINDNGTVRYIPAW